MSTLGVHTMFVIKDKFLSLSLDEISTLMKINDILFPLAHVYLSHPLSSIMKRQEMRSNGMCSAFSGLFEKSPLKRENSLFLLTHDFVEILLSFLKLLRNSSPSVQCSFIGSQKETT